MKETGMVRRIDELGRVVIPKEIRRTLRLRVSDPLEIFTERDMLCFRKYSPVGSIVGFADGVCSSLSEMTGRLCLVTDTDRVLSARGAGARDYVGKNLLREATDVLSARRAVTFAETTDGNIKKVVEGFEYAFKNVFIVPSIAGGDLVGGVIMCGDERFKEKELPLVEMCADIISRQF